MDSLGALQEVDNRHGFQQRGANLKLRSAKDEAAPANASGVAGGAEELRLGLSKGNAFYFDAEREVSCRAANIRQVGRKTFFLRDGRWIDSALDKGLRAARKPSNASARSTSDWPRTTADTLRSTWR